MKTDQSPGKPRLILIIEPAHAVTETLLTDAVLIFILFRASIQVMIGLFPLRLVKGILFFGPGFLYVTSRAFLGSEYLTTRVRR